MFEIKRVRLHRVCINRPNKPDCVTPRFVKLVDLMGKRVRYLQYSLQTEKLTVY